MKQITIIGLGNYGYALLKHFDSHHLINQKKIRLVGYAKEQVIVSTLQKSRSHPYLFTSEKISKDVVIVSQLTECIPNSDYIILAVSSHASKF